MKLDLLEKVFTDTENIYTLDEAQEIAFLFRNAVNHIDELQDDYWIQISKVWDLNIWEDENNLTQMTLYEINDGILDDDNPIRITGPVNEDFPVPEKELTEFLDMFGEREFWNVCTGKLSGEFCYAEYAYSDDEDDEDAYIFFDLKYGINDGDENSLYTDNFKISVYDFVNCKSFNQKYQAVQEA